MRTVRADHRRGLLKLFVVLCLLPSPSSKHTMTNSHSIPQHYNDYLTANKAQRQLNVEHSTSTWERPQQRPSVRAAVSRDGEYHTIFFCLQKVINFVLLPTENSTNMRKDKQGNDDAYTKTQHLHLTRERCRKDPEVRERNVYTTDSWRFAFTSWDRIVRNGRKLWKVSTVVASKFILHNIY